MPVGAGDELAPSTSAHQAACASCVDARPTTSAVGSPGCGVEDTELVALRVGEHVPRPSPATARAARWRRRRPAAVDRPHQVEVHAVLHGLRLGHLVDPDGALGRLTAPARSRVAPGRGSALEVEHRRPERAPRPHVGRVEAEVLPAGEGHGRKRYPALAGWRHERRRAAATAYGMGLATVHVRVRRRPRRVVPGADARAAGRRRPAPDGARRPARRRRRPGPRHDPADRAGHRSTSTPSPRTPPTCGCGCTCSRTGWSGRTSSNMTGVFGMLTNVVWTNHGPCAVEGFERDPGAAACAAGRCTVLRRRQVPADGRLRAAVRRAHRRRRPGAARRAPRAAARR